ncbi:hypothetical protein [Breoghania sp. L-A4]|uniref:hypothetical protein n=1 Tax=Breoghania sp. L-A4 TaxID=2304600 RepID=UPI000E358913|nr:hypothetical protein [Breoghania sp. L-A4]AXS40972.1 hypothetical protein D1F64_14230 [Breoghania sp. L-A4]
MAKSGQNANSFVGRWSYRSFLNNADLKAEPNDLLFGSGTIHLKEEAQDRMGGTIGGPGWSLDLHGSLAYGSPMEARFQGQGIVSGAEWIYAYVGWLVPVWPNSTNALQTAAMVGSVTRVIAHPSGNGGASPAGVVASFYAVRQS